MIIELVFFDCPEGSTREDTLKLYEKSAALWAKNEDLLDKYYFFDQATLKGGGVYVWKSREAAERWHGEDYQRMIEKIYGARPRIQILDALIHVTPTKGSFEIL